MVQNSCYTGSSTVPETVDNNNPHLFYIKNF